MVNITELNKYNAKLKMEVTNTGSIQDGQHLKESLTIELMSNLLGEVVLYFVLSDFLK